MLGFVIYFIIGRYFYQLATNYDKNKWLFAFVGIATYYAGTFIGGLIFGLLDVLLDIGFDWENNILLILIALPFGILACYVLYTVLEKKWKKEEQNKANEIDDIGKTSN